MGNMSLWASSQYGGGSAQFLSDELFGGSRAAMASVL